MGLFHHIVVYSPNEQEQHAFKEAGVEFKLISKASGGESVTFEIGEDDPRWNKVEALLRSLGEHRFRDTPMSVLTLREYISKIVRPGAEKAEELQDRWEPGREATLKSGELVRAGKALEALGVLNLALRQAIAEKRDMWITMLCNRGRAFAHYLGDHKREIEYAEQALPFAPDYGFAAYNLALLLLKHGHADRAMHYATEAYCLSIADETESDHDLRAAILRQWPDISVPTKLA
jgi:tetratricopeptide (TPR) repeat protein